MKSLLKIILQPPFTRNFSHKLKHNFHTLAPLEMLVYKLFYAPRWTKEKRFFYVGSPFLQGQMYWQERKALFDVVTKEKPRQCFEIGTFTGGGSTFFLSAALQKNGKGKLITLENVPRLYNKAKNFYLKKLPAQNKHITFILGDTPSAFDEYILEDKKVDCVFFDGAEDSTQTLEQYEYFKPYFKLGSVIMFHDWNTEKTAAIRPVVEADGHWKKIVELEPPDSVGFAAFRYE